MLANTIWPDGLPETHDLPVFDMLSTLKPLLNDSDSITRCYRNALSILCVRFSTRIFAYPLRSVYFSTTAVLDCV